MDTVVGNKYISILNELNIEVSKKIEGEFEASEIINTFQNYFFNKMFLDITAIKNYKDLTNLQKLSMGINMDKVILLLDAEDPISDSSFFLSKLVGMGIYNFTKDKNNLMYLYTNPNLYRDVAYLQNVSLSEEHKELSGNQSVQKRVLGIKNVTDSAGATSLIFMLKKVLNEQYNVMALELDKRDFTYFNDKNMLSIREDELNNNINRYNAEVFLVDLNKAKKESSCTDVLYLVEPSTLKLNKLMTINPRILNELRDKKVVLNKSLLSEDDIADFEVESGIKVFFNMPPVNDKKDNSKKLSKLLGMLGYVKVVSTDDEEKDEKKKSIFDLFRFK